MGEVVSIRPRRFPPLVLAFGVFVALFTVIPTLQLVAIGLLDGFSSDLFLDRLWTTSFLWLAPVTVVLIMGPLLAPTRKKLLFRIRLGAAVVTVVSLGTLVWLFSTGRLGGALLAGGCFLALMGWVDTFVLPSLGKRTTSTTSVDS